MIVVHWQNGSESRKLVIFDNKFANIVATFQVDVLCGEQVADEVCAANES